MLLEICVISYGLYTGESLYQKIRNRMRKGGARQRTERSHQQNPVARQDSAYKQAIIRNLKLSLIAVSCSISASVVYAPLGYAGIAIVLWLLLFIAKKFIHTLSDKGHLPIEILDLGYIGMLLFSGSLIAASLSSLIYFTYRFLRLVTEDEVEYTWLDMEEHAPKTAWLRNQGTEIEVPAESLEPGDIITVRTGETLPVDGIIVDGAGSAGEQMLTGEFQPVEKKIGDSVSAATLLMTGTLHVRVEQSGKDTEAARIISVLERTRQFTAYMDAAGQEMADASVAPISLLALCALPFAGPQGAAVVFISNYVAGMRLFIPIIMLNYIRLGADKGILFKDGRSLLLLYTVDTVIFDKTGTLTMERPQVRKIHTFAQAEQAEVLRLAAAAEYRQQHPIARALRNEARQQSVSLPEIDAGEYRIGYGISVTVEGQEIRVGSERFLQAEQIDLPEQLAAVQKAAYSRGHSLVCVASGDTVLGAVELEPILRPEAKRVVRALQDMNKEVILLSGDHELPTGSIAETVQADQYFAGIAPEDKAVLIEQLREQGRTVCFVGDGINDAIALKKADVSVAVQGASTAAVESAQVVFRERSLEALPEMFDIAKEFQKNMRDTFYTVTYPGVIGIGGVFLAGFTVSSAFLMYLFSTLSGMTVSQLPFLRREEKDSTSYAAQSDE